MTLTGKEMAMNAITVLLVLFVLDGEAHTFAVQTPGITECIALESRIAEILPKLLDQPPQFYAAKCAPLTAFETAI